MREYISTFITGFGEIVARELIHDLPGSSIIHCYDGLIHYRYGGDYRTIQGVIYLNNTFHVLRSFSGDNLTFPAMVHKTERTDVILLITKGGFRVRFSQKNRFAKVDTNVMKAAERQITRHSALRVDRVNPTTEFWYIIRSEKSGFYGQLLFKRKSKEKNLRKGELRPEFAYLLCKCAPIARYSVICDPFCGYGSIPRQLIKHFPVKTVYASDVAKDLISAITVQKWTQTPKLVLSVSDARALYELQDSSVDGIITDPPWGLYEQIEEIGTFYLKTIEEFSRILRKDGFLVLLSAKKHEIESIRKALGLLLEQRIDTLVNGKKAAVFVMRNTRG